MASLKRAKRAVEEWSAREQELRSLGEMLELAEGEGDEALLDELLIECQADEADAVSEQVRSEMEGGFDLRVPLEVSVGRGATWFDVH